MYVKHKTSEKFITQKKRDIVCVCEREKETNTVRERQRERNRDRESERDGFKIRIFFLLNMVKYTMQLY